MTEEEKVSRILQKIRKTKSLENYFFRKLASTNNPFPWLKILKEKGYLNPEKNPPPQEVPEKPGYYQIPYWNILGFLENVATQNLKAPDEEIANLLVETIDSIIDYRDSEGQRVENTKTDWAMIKIVASLPLEKFNDKHIEFVRILLSSKWNTLLPSAEIVKTLVPRLLSEETKDLFLKLLEVILDFKKAPSKPFFEYNSILGDYWISEALKSHRSNIAKVCGFEAAKIALSKIKEITDSDSTRFNQAIILAIEEHPQAVSRDSYESQIVNFVRDMLEATDPRRLRPLVSSLLSESHPIFWRISIHIINYYFSELQEFLWNYKGNPLEKYQLKHELFELFRSNCTSFSDEQIRTVIHWIESKKYRIKDEVKKDEELVKKILARDKKEWLSAIIETKHPKILELYEKYDKIFPEEIDHPGFDIWFEVTKGLPEPKALEKELETESNEEIADYIIRYEESERKEPYDVLAESFRRTVRENPTKFATGMKPFLAIPRRYQHALLMGLLEAWKSDREFSWDELFNFIIEIVEPYDIWKEEYETGPNYRSLIIGEIAELIENGTTSDKHAFNERLLPIARKILLIVAGRTESDLSDMGDLITSVINSTVGKILAAMVNYSLRYARLKKNEGNEKWEKRVKKHFVRCLDEESKFHTTEYFVTVGLYLVNLYYLDKTWVQENINKLFPKDDQVNWKAAFVGYLFGSSRLSKDIYSIHKINQNYSKALQTEFDDETSLNRLVQHISIGYLQGLEELKDEQSLINQLITIENPKQLLSLVRFFWMLRDKLPNESRRKVKPLWGSLLPILTKHKEDPEFQEVLGSLSQWLVLIEKLDEEIVGWLKLSVGFIKDVHLMFFIEYLLKHVEVFPNEVGEIYLGMLNSNIFPSHDQENIRKLIGSLYEKNLEGIADRICSMYLDNGYYFLKPLYEEHRQGRG